MDCILGIDFGNSIAKVGSTTLEPTGTLNIHSLSVRITPSTPTYICFEPQTRVFGASAQALQRWNISTTVGSLKQALAKSSAPLAGDPDLSLIGTVSSDTTLDYRMGPSLTSTQHAAMFLGHLRRSVVDHYMINAVITVPCWYTNEDRQAMLDAAMIAGLHPVGLVRDIVAVALTYGIDHFDRTQGDQSRTVAFIDIGESDSSVAVVTFYRGRMIIHTIISNDDLGGRDIDDVLAGAIEKQIQGVSGVEPLTDPKVRLGLLAECEKLKKSLSTVHAADVAFHTISQHHGGKQRWIRAEFDSLITPFLDDISDLVEAALAISDMNSDQIHAIELFGGTTLIPAVQRRIQSIFDGKLPSCTLNYDTAAALGATYICASHLARFPHAEIPLQDVGEFPLEIQWADSTMDLISMDGDGKLAVSKFSDSDLASMMELEMALEGADLRAIDAEERREELVEFMYLLWDKIDGIYVQRSEASELTRLLGALQDVMDWLLFAEKDCLTRGVYEAHLERLHALADPIEARSLPPKMPPPRPTGSRMLPPPPPPPSADDHSVSFDQRRIMLFDWGTWHVARFTQVRDPQDLNEAISCLEKVVQMAPLRHPDLSAYHSSLGLSFLLRFDRFGDSIDLDKAISTLEFALRASLGRDSTALFNLGAALARRSEYNGTLEDIDRAISINDRALVMCLEGHPHRLECLANLCRALHIRFDRLGDLPDLERAITISNEVVQHTPIGHPDRPHFLRNLANGLRLRFERLGEIGDIEKAVSYSEESVQLVPDDHREKPDFLGGLGACLLNRFEHFGCDDDVDRAVAVSVLAVDLAKDGHRNKHASLTSLGNSYTQRFLQIGNVTDINHAIRAYEQAARITKGHADRPSCFTNLGRGLAVRFEHYGDITDIDKSIRVQEKAVDFLHDRHPDKPNCLSNLGYSLSRRFSRLHEVTDTSRSIEAFDQAVALVPESHPDKFRFLMNLGNGLLTRFESQRSDSDLQRALSLYEKVVQILPEGHLELPNSLSNHGNAHLMSFEKFGDITSLDRAIDLYGEASRLTPDDRPTRHSYLGNLGNAHLQRYGSLGDDHDIDKAVLSLELAVDATPNDHPDRPGCLDTLARALVTRFKGRKRLSDYVDLDRAIRLYSEAAFSQSGRPSTRFTAARNWVTCARDLKHHSLRAAYTCLLDLLPRVAWLGLSLERRREEIAGIGGIACDAAATAIEYGDFQQAVVWLEQGRLILWSQGLQLRTPLEELKDVHPHLAERLEAVSIALEQFAFSGSRVIDPIPGVKRTNEEQARRQRALADDWDKIITEIRTKPNFSRFLQSKDFHELTPATRNGPVAIITTSSGHCDALLMTANGVCHVELPAKYQEIEKLVDLMKSLLWSSGRMSRGSERGMRTKQVRAPDRWAYILETLWILVVEPVVSGLHLQPSESPPRLWWCPTGLFSQLPLHAAGVYESSNRVSIHNYAVSSYTPTLGGLLRLPAATASRQMLAVGVSETEIAHQALPMVKREMSLLRSIVPEQSLTVLEGREANVARILGAIVDSTCLHLACHAHQDLANPLSSAFILYGEKLELSRLIGQSLPKAELAFLSACQTAKGDASTPDEALHLAGAMMFAGFRSVIATMWSIDDQDGPVIAKAVYSELFTQSSIDSSAAARALHTAVCRMQQEGVPFERWVPFITLGL